MRAGNNIEVVFGGRPAAGRGCDFQDAVLMINGIKCCGNVEIHVTSDLWKRHGHNRDDKYNNVKLHVVLWENGGLPALLQSGISIPTVILGSAPAQFTIDRQGCPYTKRLSCSKLEDILCGCGLQRLSLKAGEFGSLIFTLGPQQALYAGICRALGYSKNKLPMSKLAELISFHKWQEMQGESIERKMAIIMGIAGLLPSQSGLSAELLPDNVTEKLEIEWNLCRGTEKRMRREEWCFSGVRPANSPLRRIAALCYLMSRITSNGLLAGKCLIQDRQCRKAVIALEAKLMLPNHGYWGCHYDFGKPLWRPQKLLGKGRADEIIINSILPFYLALAWMKGDNKLAERVANLYSVYPALPENELTRFMQKLLLPGGWQRTNSCMQQGMLHIFYQYCQTRNCSQCPVFMERRQGRGQRQAARCQTVPQ